MAVDHMVASTARQRLHELTLHTQHGNPISREQTHLLALKRKTATFMGLSTVGALICDKQTTVYL